MLRAHVWMAFICAYGMYADTAQAGAWTLEPGSGQIISTTTYSQASRFFSDAHKADTPVVFKKMDTRLYSEHGLKENLTVLGTVSFQSIDYIATMGPDTFEGFGDLQLGVRYQLYKSSGTVFAVQPSVIFGQGGEDVPDANLGQGRVSYELRGLVGRSFKLAGKDSFVDLQMATRLRSSGDPNGYRFDASMGVKITPKSQLFGQVFYASDNAKQGQFDIIRPTESLKLQASWLYDLNARQSLHIGGYNTVWGRNMVAETAGFVGFWQRY